jgi:hypothetical protein
MTDNAVNDRYTIPLLKQVDFRLQNRNPRVTLLEDNGNPTINDNLVILHENTDDYVYSDETYAARYNGLVFECNLPVIPAGNNSIIYAGIHDDDDDPYGCEIRYDGGYKIRFYGDGDYSDYYTYNAGDLFRMYINGRVDRNDDDYNDIGRRAYFSINGDVKTDFYYSDSSQMYLEIGFDTHDDNGINYIFSNILYYQTGRIGQDGENGNNRYSLLSGSGRPDIIPTLGNDGDTYNDVLTNILWRKDETWYPITFPNLTSGVVSLAAGTPSPVDLFNFVGTSYNSILITIAFAQNATTRIPDRLVQVSVNLAEDGTNVPKWNNNGAFPANITIQTSYTPSVNPTFIGVRLARDGTIVTAYNYITYKIQIIN